MSKHLEIISETQVLGNIKCKFFFLINKFISKSTGTFYGGHFLSPMFLSKKSMAV